MPTRRVFARPWTSSECTHAGLPNHWTNFQAGVGTTYHHLQAEGGPYSTPRSDHKYSYPLTVPVNNKAGARLSDEYPQDNYGKLKVTVRKLASSDCQNGGSQAVVNNLILTLQTYPGLTLPSNFPQIADYLRANDQSVCNLIVTLQGA